MEVDRGVVGSDGLEAKLLLGESTGVVLRKSSAIAAVNCCGVADVLRELLPRSRLPSRVLQLGVVMFRDSCLIVERASTW